jgi:AcrR family transcriptional regulator
MAKDLQTKTRIRDAGEEPAVRAFRWADELERQSKKPGLPKGQRTLLRIKFGTAAALETIPYAALKISDIAKHARVSYGLFYHYFGDRQAAVLDVLRGFIETADRQYREIHVSGDAYAAVKQSNQYYIELFRLNAGLMRAIIALSEEAPEFSAYWQDTAHGWHERISRAVAAAPENKGKGYEPLVVAYALGGMIDQVCLQHFVYGFPRLRSLVKHDDAQLADILSRIWYRAVFGSDPEGKTARPQPKPARRSRT